MKRRVAKVLRRCADRIDPGPRICYRINVGTKGPSLADMRRYQEQQAGLFSRVG